MNSSKAVVALASSLNALAARFDDADIAEKARIISSSFTRNRKIPLPHLLEFEMFRSGNTVGQDLDFFFQKSNQTPSNNAMLHREAVLNYDVWQPLFQCWRDRVYGKGLLDQKIKGYFLLAVDGSKVELPPSLALNHVFGGSLNRTVRTVENIQTPLAHISAFFDPLNQQVLDFIVEPYNVSEIPMMMDHLERQLPFLEGKKVIITGDRYYGSVEFFRWCEMHGFNYLVRAKSNFFKDIRAEIPDDVLDTDITVTLNKPWIKRLKNDAVKKSFEKDPSIDVRLVRNDYHYQETCREISRRTSEPYTAVTDKEVHVEYFTNLPKEVFTLEEVVSIYHDKRWDIETYYGRLKNDLKLPMFHSANPILIINQMMGKVLLSNIAGAIYTLAAAEIKDDEHIPNYQRILQRLLSFSFLEAFLKKKISGKIIESIRNLAVKAKNMVRKDRHVKRWNRFMKSIPRKKYRIGGRSNPKVQPCRFGGFITTAK